MKFQQIRNATAIIEYAGRRFLVDPMLSGKGSFPGFPGTANCELSNPLVDLPVPIHELSQVDAVILTHTHADHWDETAKAVLPKDLLVFVQNKQDQEELGSAGFTNIRVLGSETEFEGIRLIKTPGQHGSDAIMEKLGDLLGTVCGVIFKHPSEKTLYLAGDTVWNHHVEDSLETYNPEVVILNSGDAQVVGLGSIIMGKWDVLKVHEAVPNAKLIATHMEAVNHAVLSRKELREFSIKKGFDTSLAVPEDGETVVI